MQTWNPDQQDIRNRRTNRAQATREAHAAADTKRLPAEMQESLDDPRPDIAHDDVMAEMDADLAALPASAGLRHGAQQVG